MLRTHGILKVQKATTVTRNGKTYAKLTCSWRNGEQEHITVLVPVRKHANFLEGKTVCIDGVVGSENIIFAELSDIWTIDTGYKRNGNGNGSYNRYAENKPAEPSAEDDEVPF